MAQTSATHQSIRRQSLDTQHRRRQRKCAWASSPHVRCAPPCQTCDGLAGDGGKEGGGSAARNSSPVPLTAPIGPREDIYPLFLIAVGGLLRISCNPPALSPSPSSLLGSISNLPSHTPRREGKVHLYAFHVAPCDSPSHHCYVGRWARQPYPMATTAAHTYWTILQVYVPN